METWQPALHKALMALYRLQQEARYERELTEDGIREDIDDLDQWEKA